MSYYGLSPDPVSGVLRLVTEYVEDGSLLEWLRSESDQYPASTNVKISMDITAGMDHISKKDIIHRDLAARNILVRKLGRKDVLVKLCDFGLGRNVEYGNYYVVDKAKQTALPVKWTAPESVEFRKFSTKSDVFSFGIVMWECWSHGAEPYAGWELMEVFKRVKRGDRLEAPFLCSPQVYELMLECWNLDPKQRPGWSELFNRLNLIATALREEEEGGNDSSSEGSDGRGNSSAKNVLGYQENTYSGGYNSVSDSSGYSSPGPAGYADYAYSAAKPEAEEGKTTATSARGPPQLPPKPPPRRASSSSSEQKPSPRVSRPSGQAPVRQTEVAYQTSPSAAAVAAPSPPAYSSNSPRAYHPQAAQPQHPQQYPQQSQYGYAPPQHQQPSHLAYPQYVAQQPYQNTAPLVQSYMPPAPGSGFSPQLVQPGRSSYTSAPLQSNIQHFCSSIRSSRQGYLVMRELMHLDFSKERPVGGSVWEFSPCGDGASYFISMTIVCPPGQPERAFLTVDSRDGMKLKVRLMHTPDRFQINNSALMHTATGKYLCFEGGQCCASRDRGGEWEKVTLDRMPVERPLTVNFMLLCRQSFDARMGARRHGSKSVGVKNPTVDGRIVSGVDNKLYSNWHFQPNEDGSAFRIQLLTDDSENDWGLSVGNASLLIVAKGARDEFRMEADVTKTVSLRHVESGKLVSAELKFFRASRDAKGDWESFVLNRTLGDNPKASSSSSSSSSNKSCTISLGSSNGSLTPKMGSTVSRSPAAVPFAENEAWAIKTLERSESEHGWEKIAYQDVSLVEAKEMARTSGKPLYLSICYLLDGRPCLGARLRRCTALSDTGIADRVSHDTIPVRLELKGFGDIPIDVLPCLADHQAGLQLLAKSVLGSRTGDAEVVISVDSSGKCVLQGIMTMIQAVSLKEHFELFSFATWFAKSVKDAQKALAKIGEGKLLFSATKSLSSIKKKKALKNNEEFVSPLDVPYLNFSATSVLADESAFDRVEASGEGTS